MESVEYEHRKHCELRGCSAEHWSKVLRLKDHETDLGEFDIYLCNRCKLGFTDPYPTEETSKYLYDTKDSADFDVVQDTVIDAVKDHLSLRLLRQLGEGRRVDRVLDYSTGNGRFATSAAKAFPNAYVDAVDYQSEPPPLLLSPRREPRIEYVTVSNFANLDRKYDLIVLRHVLEHTHHPVELVKQLGSRLAHSGLFYIEVPNLDSGCAKVFGKNWKGHYVPRHLFHFTIESLTETITLAGLDAEVGRNEMPAMGNTVALFTGVDKAHLATQLLGVALHPVQLLIEALYRSSTCIHAKCTLPARREYETT